MTKTAKKLLDTLEAKREGYRYLGIESLADGIRKYRAARELVQCGKATLVRAERTLIPVRRVDGYTQMVPSLHIIITQETRR